MKPVQLTLPRTGSSVRGRDAGLPWAAAARASLSANLRDLRAAFGPLQLWRFLRSAVVTRCRGVLGQPQLEQFTGGHRVVSPNDHNLAEEVLQSFGSFPVQC